MLVGKISALQVYIPSNVMVAKNLPPIPRHTRKYLHPPLEGIAATIAQATPPKIMVHIVVFLRPNRLHDTIASTCPGNSIALANAKLR